MQVRLLHITTVPMSLTFLRGQLGFMRSRGFEISVLSSPGDALDEFGAQQNVPTFSVEMTRRMSPYRDLLAARSLFQVIRALRPDIVHAHTPKGGLLGMLAAWLARVPVRVYHMRGLPLMGAVGARRVLLRLAEAVSCHLAHRVICVSHSLRSVAVREKICYPAKITVLAGGSGQGIDAERRFNPATLAADARAISRSRFGIPEQAAVVGFVGRIVRDKGVEELATAWMELRKEFEHLHLLVVGPFEPQDPVASSTRALLESDPRVHLVGMDWNTPSLYAAMDVVALPTYREGFPNVPLEAAAMALPVVATLIPGCIDAVENGVTGTLVPPGDSGALTEAIRAYLKDPSLRHLHGVAGRERVLKDFRQEVVWEALYGEYCQLLRQRGMAVPDDGSSPVDGCLAA